MNRFLPAVVLAAAFSGCSDPSPGNGESDGSLPPTAGEQRDALAPDPEDAVFRRVRALEFVHHRFQTPDKKYLPETAGSGVGLLDFDGDGDLDVYAVQCCPLPGYPGPDLDASNRLYRNEDGLRFTDVTATAGVGDEGYGMGVTCPDVDNDGDPDLFVTNVRENVLYRNEGDGSFVRIQASGLEDAHWSTAAGWADIDGDGDLDVYLANYARIDFADYNVCGGRHKGERFVSYCHPDTFVAAPDRLFRNDGEFRFTDITNEAQVVDTVGKGLAVIPMDHNGDGRADFFVANDSNENFLWLNQGENQFEDWADLVGVSVSSTGSSQACMGSDVGDVDGDLDFDIFSANFGKEPNVLYKRITEDFYEDESYQAGLGEESYLFTGFGADFFDYDADADLDLIVINGHIVDVIELIDPSQSFEQQAHFYENQGDGTFLEIGASLGPYFTELLVGRGLATGDLDNDGDLDFVVNNNNGRMMVLENTLPHENHWVGFKLQGTRSPRDAILAQIVLESGSKTQIERVRGSTSYLSWLDLRVYFGLGKDDSACRARIRWPSGQEQVVESLAVDQYHEIVEPE